MKKERALKAITIKGIDPDIFKRFKVACAENDTNMRAAILWFMGKYGKGEITSGRKTV